MSPHAALVLNLARGHWRRVEEAIAKSPSWAEASQLAARHEVAALCAWRANQPECPADIVRALDVSFRESIEEAFVHHSLRNLSLQRDLTEIAEAMDTAGVSPMFLKGPWVAFCAYPEAGTRPVGDIDVCVPEADAVAAARSLQALGYRPMDGLPADPRAALRQAHYGRQFRFSAPGRRLVELHFRLINVGPPTKRETWVWETARELEVGTARLRVPGAEAMLLHLILHANQHAFGVLRLLHDIYWCWKRDAHNLDADRLVKVTRSLRCGSSVYHGLELAAQLTGAGPFPPALGALRPSKLRRRVFRHLWDLKGVADLSTPRRSATFEAPLLYLLEMGGLGDKLRYSAGIARQMLSRRRGAEAGFVGDPPRAHVRDTSHPQTRENLLLRELNGTYALYDPEADSTLVLSPAAAFVAECCDGQHSADDIAHIVAKELSSQSPVEIRTLVSRVIADFRDRGILRT